MKLFSKRSLVMFAITLIAMCLMTVVASAQGETNNAITCTECQQGTIEAGQSYCTECGTLYGPEFENGATCSEDHSSKEGAKFCGVCGEDFNPEKPKYFATFWALVPPLVAIVLALITKEVYSSLFVGILLGGLLAANWKPVEAFDNVLNAGIISAVSGTAGIFIFLVVLGALVALINKAGGSAAFGRWAETHIKSKVGASIATFVLGVLIFIDDYFNCLTVGSVMLPVTDKHKISRAKLAFLIDATAAPICMIAPVSSWAAAVSQYAEGTAYSGIELFIRAIPYNFYSLLMLVFVVSIVLMKVDFGPMKKHELNAANGDLFTSGQDKVESVETEKENPKGRVIDLILPVIVLVALSVIGLIYVGGYFSGASFIDAFGDTDATVGLPWGAIIALVFTVIYLMLRRIVTFKEAMECIPKGFKAMVPAILILTFATALKEMTGLLGAADFVEAIMSSAAPGLANFLPAIIFVVACVLAFSTGTSWGTFGILIPIVITMFEPTSEMFIIGISACLAGAVCGDHCSPISDTTIMSSAGSRSNHVNHVSTQLPYAIYVAVISFVMYLIAAFVQNAIVLLAIGIALVVGGLFVIKMLGKKATK
jgi:Na+/H+ antiporter NhaC